MSTRHCELVHSERQLTGEAREVGAGSGQAGQESVAALASPLIGLASGPEAAG